MNTKKAIAILYIFLWVMINPVFAQNKQNSAISGKLLNHTSKEAIGHASVVLYSLPDTTMITGVLSNTEGIFSFDKIPQGNYLIKSNFVGYETLVKTIEVKNTPFKFPEALYMTPSTFALDEVVISVTQREKQITVEKTGISKFAYIFDYFFLPLAV